MALTHDPGTIEENNFCNSDVWNVRYEHEDEISLANNYWGEPAGLRPVTFSDINPLSKFEIAGIVKSWTSVL